MSDKTKICITCKVEKTIDLFRVTHNQCKICESIKSSICKAKNKERISLTFKEWRRKNLEMVTIKQKEWRSKNKEHIANSYSKWYRNNMAERNILTARRRSRKKNAIPCWFGEFDSLAIKEAYSLAKFRGAATGINWHVDHVVPLQSKIVCGLHCSDNLQVITAFANISKGNRSWPNHP